MNNIKDPAFFLGVVEDRMDPLKLGRVRVRVLGLHTHDKTLLPTEDLPWAYKVQPTTSGAITGIGHAPVGVMEGTWVLIQYIDPDKQMPFVVGSVGGIPQSRNPALESFELYNNETNVVQSGSGGQVVSGDGTPVTTGTATDTQPTPTQQTPNFKRASDYTISEDIITKLKASEAFRSAPYQDGVGVWTIGYGSTYLKDGSRVTASTPPINETQGDELMRYKLRNDFESAVKSAVRVPITQSMYDSLVHLAYNVGPGGLRSFVTESGLNSGDYEKAAEYMLNYRVRPGTNVERGLRNRRQFEKSYFLRDGVPQKDGTIQETPESQQRQEEQVRQANPEATQQEIEDAVYYRRSLTEFLDPRIGFKDPNLKYPLRTHLDEPDTNRLARHEKINQTIVYFKESLEHKGVEKANGKGTWDQSKTPYNAKYPFNNVWQSESGHFLEFDDTAGAERVHLYHKKGTFTEVDHNGTQVNFIVGDGYVIMERNGHVHVMGNVDVNVEGAKTLKVGGTMDVQVNGAATINVHDNANVNVSGSTNMTSGGNILIKAGGIIAMDAQNIYFNSGLADGLSLIGDLGENQFDTSPLPVNTRGDDVCVNYEVCDDNPAAVEAYKERMVREGLATREEMEAKPEVKEEKKPEENNVQPITTECGIVEGTTDFTGQEQLSRYYNLSQLTAGYSRKLRNFNNTTASQAYCNLKALCQNVLDPIKAKYPTVQINSGYRIDIPPGGVTNSQHLTGQAVDISFPGLSREQLYDRVLEIQQMIPYDQLILEYANGPGWIHISFNTNGNRKQQFSMNHHQRVSKDLYTIARVY